MLGQLILVLALSYGQVPANYAYAPSQPGLNYPPVPEGYASQAKTPSPYPPAPPPPPPIIIPQPPPIVAQ